jgi:predicted nucleic acid-binding protein
VAAGDEPVILDTNILFSTLLSSHSSFADVLLQSDRRFFACEQVIVELFKRKEKLVESSKLSEDDVVHLYHILLRRITVFKEDLISKENWAQAHALCHDVDETDTPHVALALELSGLLWTGDQRLKEGLIRKGFKRFFAPEQDRS